MNKNEKKSNKKKKKKRKQGGCVFKKPNFQYRHKCSKLYILA